MNEVKRLLGSGRPALGTWITINSVEVAEIAAASGFDWITIDMEHGAIDFADLLRLGQAITAGSSRAVPMVRVPSNDPTTIKRVLDAGMRGIVVPMVNSASEAAAAVMASRYPPAGIRGVGTGRANGWGARYAEYLVEANDDIVVVVQCEHRSAVEAIADIATVEGVDAVFIGPDDLSASMGSIGNSANPVVQQAISAVLAACTAAGKPVGLHIVDPATVGQRLEQGFSFLALGEDSDILGSALRTILSQARAHA